MNVVESQQEAVALGPTGRGLKRGREEFPEREDEQTSSRTSAAAAAPLSCGHSNFSVTPFKDLGTPASGIDDVYSSFVSLSSTANAKSAAARAGVASQARKARKMAAGATAGGSSYSAAPELEPLGEGEDDDHDEDETEEPTSPSSSMEEEVEETQGSSVTVMMVTEGAGPRQGRSRMRARTRALFAAGVQGGALNRRFTPMFSRRGGGRGGEGGERGSRRSLSRKSSRASVMHHIFMCGTCERPKHGLWNPRCRCFFSYLPHELLAAGIFSFLSRKDLLRSASAVCTRWAFASTDPVLWEGFDLAEVGMPRRFTDEQVAVPLRLYARSMSAVKLCSQRGLTDATLAVLAESADAAASAASAAAGPTDRQADMVASGSGLGSGSRAFLRARRRGFGALPAAGQMQMQTQMQKQMQMQPELDLAAFVAGDDGGREMDVDFEIGIGAAGQNDVVTSPFALPSRVHKVAALKHLRTFHACAGKFSAPALRSFVPRLSCVRELSLSGCTAVDDTVLTAVAMNCAHLRILYLRGCALVTSAGVGAVVKAVGNELEELVLSGCVDVSADAVAEMIASPTEIEASLRAAASRRELAQYRARGYGNSSASSSAAAAAAAAATVDEAGGSTGGGGQARLRALSYEERQQQFQQNMNPRALPPVAMTMGSGAGGAATASGARFAMWSFVAAAGAMSAGVLPVIEPPATSSSSSSSSSSLLSSIEDATRPESAMSRASSSASALSSLSSSSSALQMGDDMDSGGGDVTSQPRPKRATLSRLRVLKMRGCEPSASDALFAALAGPSGPGPRLRVLDVGCANPFGGSPVTDDGLLALAGSGASSGAAAGLRELRLSGCAEVTDYGLRAVLSRLRRGGVGGNQGGGLTSLDLGGCRKLGDATARAIRESCPGLRELKMRGLSRVTAAGVQSLALGCTRLEAADLSNCAAVRSAAPLAYLLAACPGMRSLSVGRTVPQGEVRALAARFSGVAIKNW